MTLQELAETYKQKTGKTIDPKKLVGIMKHTEDNYLARKEIVDKDDSPIITWRTTIDILTRQTDSRNL